MTFVIACGDVIPGCPAHFEAEDKNQLMDQVGDHVAREHGITELTPEVLAAVDDKIVVRQA